MRNAYLIVATLFALAAPARAQPDAAAFSMFASGAYEEAAALATAEGGAENLALAARALNAKAYLQSEDKASREISKRALELAEDAMDADASVVEGHLQAAIALAQRGGRMAPIRAFVLGIAGRARDQLDYALEADPENPWALSSSAAWHLEVARRVGEGRFGSDSALGFEQFQKARALDPDNILIAYECALRLLASDKPQWREAALSSLDMVVASAPDDAFSGAMKERGVALAAAVAAGRKAERAFVESQP
ncbi:MAG: hypothetical protein R3C58_08640 [Parvularculaceae bacterium]